MRITKRIRLELLLKKAKKKLRSYNPKGFGNEQIWDDIKQLATKYYKQSFKV